MHGVTETHHNVSYVPHSQHQCKELFTKLICFHAYDYSQPSQFVVWIQNLTKLQRVVGGILSLTCSKHSIKNIGISCQPINILKGLKLEILTPWQKLHWSHWALHQVEKGFNKTVGIFCYKKMINLDSQGIGNSTKKFIVCSIKLTSVFTNLEHACRTS
jgi:hypothetical protein